MALRFHNTTSRKLEELVPIKPGRVGLYTCGPTVYDTAHIGNLRTFLFEDLLKRYLIYKGLQVHHIMNITDVDDRTIAKVNREGRSLSEITNYYADKFFTDLDKLGILPADSYPRATEYVSEMIAGIERLIEKGHAYITDDGSVFFSVSSFPDYGQLAHLEVDQLRLGERVASDDYEKEEIRDFVLWKAFKPEDGAVKWESPWGWGRPGWHMECSIMSTEFLGEHFDIHCGGVDNIFPHHENEIAQSKCLYDTPFVNLWMHSEHLIVDGRKMSKSEGNFYTLDDLLEQGLAPDAIRYCLLSTHYRQKLNFTVERVRDAQKAINRLRELVRRLEAVNQHNWGRSPAAPDDTLVSALDDDLNIAGALGAIFSWAKELFAHLDDGALSGLGAQEALSALKKYDQLLGVIFSKEAIGEDIEALITEREAARTNSEWARADEIRDQLLGQGIILEDTPSGTIWKRQ